MGNLFAKFKTKQEGAAVDPPQTGAQVEDHLQNDQSPQQPDFDPSDTKEQDAALRIQTKYRQFHAKKEVQHMREEKAATIIQAGFRGMHDRNQVKQLRASHEKELEPEEAPAEAAAETPAAEPAADADINDPTKVEAAIKIQAGFKGYKARREIKLMKETKSTPAAGDPEPPEQVADMAAVDIDLSNPEVNAAATKIQAGFRGHKAREEVKLIKETKSTPAADEPEPSAQVADTAAVDIDLSNPEVNAAAAKIQAGFRGHKAREEVKLLKAEAERKAEASHAEEAPAAEAGADQGIKDTDLNDPEMQLAATKIQAGFKGMKARQEVKALRETRAQEMSTGEGTATEGQPSGDQPASESQAVHDEDPEVQQAATKIQAAFRGMEARREVKAMKEAQNKSQSEEQSAVEQQEATGAGEGKVDIDLSDPELQAAATKIQAGFRGYQTRKNIQDKTGGGAEGGEGQ